MGSVGGAVINPASFERWVPRTEAARRRLAANPPVAITGLPLFLASHYAEPSAEAIFAASQTPSAISAQLARSERAELAQRLLCGHAHVPITGFTQGQSIDSAVHSLADSAFVFGTPPVPAMSQPLSVSQLPIAQRARSIIVKRQRAQHAQHAQHPVHCQASTQAPTQASTHVESTQSLAQRAQRADFCGQASTDASTQVSTHVSMHASTQVQSTQVQRAQRLALAQVQAQPLVDGVRSRMTNAPPVQRQVLKNKWYDTLAAAHTV